MTRVDRARVRVVVVEPKLAERSHLVQALESEAGITVVGQAVAQDAATVVARMRPDVVTVDLAMPRNGGLRAIEQIMGHSPTPILVLVAVERVAGTQAAGTRAAGTRVAVSPSATAAVAAGAVNVMATPSRWTTSDKVELCQRVRALRGATVLRHPRGRMIDVRQERRTGSKDGSGQGVIAVAASTGGPPALAALVAGLDGVKAPILIVQHIHPDFVDGLVAWLNRVASFPVRLAVHRDKLRSGAAYVGPGGVHLRVDAHRRIVLDPEPMGPHRPSADQLFLSVAEHVGRMAVGVVLTGMGAVGAAGLLAMRERGALTIAQDRESSAVFGMPGAAKAAGAVSHVLPLEDIAAAVMAAERGVTA